MGLMRILKLEGPDFVAFLAAGLLGFLVSSLVPGGPWATLVYVLVSYHLFLAWLVLTGERDPAIQFPIVQTIVTHLACLTLVLPLGFVGYFVSNFLARLHPGVAIILVLILMRIVLPVSTVLRYAVTGLAVFERYWLFSGDEVKKVSKPVEAPASPVLQAATGDDFAAWQQYLAQRKPGSRRIGSSLKAEYEQWLLARQQARQTAASNPSDQ